MSSTKQKLTDLVGKVALRLDGNDFEPLTRLIGEERFVLLGEASHGTHEFYQTRGELTRRLIEHHGFHGVVAEADWPDAYRVNRYVRHVGTDASAEEALGGFKRFPTWMWRNTEVVKFVEWLRGHNARIDPSRRVGFYGMDLYSLHASIDAVVGYLEKTDPEAAARARDRYSCFDHYGEDPQAYGYAASFGMGKSCEEQVVKQLVELRRQAGRLQQEDGHIAADRYFYAEQNARLVQNAERYYRTMFSGRISSWNLRDQHMVETVQALASHLDRAHEQTRLVLWAHNSHLGDARYTQMGDQGEWNVGQLMREYYDGRAVLIGFSTYSGSVTAASAWGADAQRMGVRDGMEGSYERLFHEAGLDRSVLLLRDDMGDSDLAQRAVGALDEPRLQRAIGVIYRPDSERLSHYFYAHLPRQFDAMIHIDQTRALQPLERSQTWARGELPQTYPEGV